MKKLFFGLVLFVFSGCLVDSAKDGTGIEVDCSQAGLMREQLLADLFNRCGAEIGSTFTNYPAQICKSGAAEINPLDESAFELVYQGRRCAVFRSAEDYFYISGPDTNYTEVKQGTALQNFWINGAKYSVSGNCNNRMQLQILTNFLAFKLSEDYIITCGISSF
jgi:hypothetical protein